MLLGLYLIALCQPHVQESERCNLQKATDQQAVQLAEDLRLLTHSSNLQSLVCTYKGPGAGDPCHDCRDGVSEGGAPCLPCAEPTVQSCLLDERALENETLTLQAAVLLEHVHAMHDSAMGGHSSRGITMLRCASSNAERNYCHYCANLPE